LWKKTQSRVTDFIRGGGCGHKISLRVLKKLRFTALGVNCKAVFYQEDFQDKAEPKSNSGPLSMSKHPIYTPIQLLPYESAYQSVSYNIPPPLPAEPWYNRIKPTEYPSSYLMSPRRLPLLFPASRCSIPSAAVSSHGSQLV